MTTDICRNKHGGNPCSEEAFNRASLTIPECRQKVLDAVREAGSQGITCRELAAVWFVGMNVISGRFSELKKAGLVKDSGKRRDGCAVIIEKL